MISTWSRVHEYPQTLIDRVDLNLDLLPIARPLGFALTAAHFLLRAPLWPSSGSSGSPASVLRAQGTKKSRWEGRWDTPEDQRAGRGMLHWVSSHPPSRGRHQLCWTDTFLSSGSPLPDRHAIGPTRHCCDLECRLPVYEDEIVQDASQNGSSPRREFCNSVTWSLLTLSLMAASLPGSPVKSERAQGARRRRVCRVRPRDDRVEAGADLCQVSRPEPDSFPL